MTIGKKRLFPLAPAIAGVGALSIGAVAYACTAFKGTFTVTGGSALSGTVTATGTGFMTQTVSAGIAKSVATTNSMGIVKVSTGLDGSGVGLPQGGYDINFYNSGALGASPGYTNHTTWNLDCMSGSAQGTNLGTVTVGTAGTITAQTGGSGPVGGVVTYSNAPDPNTDVSPKESAVCISDSSAANGNEAPITII